MSRTDPKRSDTAAQLDRLVAQASAAGFWERAWPLLWRGLGVVLAFLAVSWLGLWLDLPATWRIVGLVAFAAALVAVLSPLVRLRRADRRWRT
ncbi:DUF4175 family protein, partial [Methylobacterium sp. WL103]|uniref:DUF4175 family protein n=1 Tax=Methylobacterium sp. WL103 TaxID=2603891 RepID=UPI001FEEEB87